jgi:hypothetical protein
MSPRDSAQHPAPKTAACMRSMSIYTSLETSTDLSDPPRQLQKQPATTTHQLLPGGVGQKQTDLETPAALMPSDEHATAPTVSWMLWRALPPKGGSSPAARLRASFNRCSHVCHSRLARGAIIEPGSTTSTPRRAANVRAPSPTSILREPEPARPRAGGLAGLTKVGCGRAGLVPSCTS